MVTLIVTRVSFVIILNLSSRLRSALNKFTKRKATLDLPGIYLFYS